jgi:hypothetical protein
MLVFSKDILLSCAEKRSFGQSMHAWIDNMSWLSRRRIRSLRECGDRMEYLKSGESAAAYT